MSTSSEFRIVKKTDSGKRWLAHEGHTHYWTADKSAAMVYSKIEVAQALAAQKGGELEAA